MLTCCCLTSPLKGCRRRLSRRYGNSIHEIVKLGRTVLIAESELQHVPDYANRIYVMERGELVFGGTLEKARHDATVRRIIGETL